MPPESSKKPLNIWYLLPFLKNYTGLIFWTAIFLIAGRVASTMDPIWLKKIIDGVGKGTTLSTLMPVVIIYFGFKFLTALFDYLRDLIFSPAEMGIARTLSDHLFSHLLALPTSYHLEQKLGGMARKITRGGRAITFILDFLVINILPTIIELLVVTAFLLRLYAPIYAITTFATVVVYTYFTIWATEKRQKYRVAANTADDEVSSLEVDSLANIETVKYFNNEVRMHAQYVPAIDARYDLSVASNKLFALISGVQSIIILVGLGIILYVAIKQTLGGLLTIGDLVLLTTYIVRLASPIGVLGFIYRQIKDGFADLEGMARMLQEEITVPEPKHPVKIPVPAGEVVFDNVSFQYASSRVVLGNISIRVAPGQKIAFVGPSGVGKSTIVKLIFRLFDPTHGRILIDGVDLRELDKENRRSMFAIVPQEPALFNTSIAENIRFGKTDATQEEIEAAAKLASIDSYIQTLPAKYETMVGERGVKLSGGEKQRVAIARAIIRQPKVLVFDEATSSLDSRSEKDIQTALDTISKGRTTIAVAHRLSTIAGSDQIYVLNKGGVAEQGTHRELLAKDGLYAQLWKLQSSQKHHHEEENELVAE
jgi:ABC-type transport system involved in Fe-S cluster assembly fused permease/ATPase subunit